MFLSQIKNWTREPEKSILIKRGSKMSQKKKKDSSNLTFLYIVYNPVEINLFFSIFIVFVSKI